MDLVFTISSGKNCQSSMLFLLLFTLLIFHCSSIGVKFKVAVSFVEKKGALNINQLIMLPCHISQNV